MIKEILKNAKTNKSLVGIRTNFQNFGESIIGYILEVDQNSFTISEIDEYGLSIGVTTLEINIIYNIDIGDRYEERLHFIHKNVSALNIATRCTIWKNGSSLIHYFPQLIDEKSIVTLFFIADEYSTGIIINFDENFIKINNIGDDGDDDGFSYHKIENLEGIRHSSLAEQKIQLLYMNRKLFYKNKKTECADMLYG